MVARVALLFALGLLSGCLDTHDASLGEQEEARAPDDDASGADAGDAGRPLDGGMSAQRDGDGDDEEERDAATSLLCRLEPWHCL